MGLASLTTMSKGEAMFLDSVIFWSLIEFEMPSSTVCYAIEHCTLTIKSIQDLHSKGLRLCGRNSTIRLMYFLVATSHASILTFSIDILRKNFKMVWTKSLQIHNQVRSRIFILRSNWEAKLPIEQYWAMLGY